MLPKDLFKKIRRIQITTSRLVTDVFAGQYHSVFKGRGMEFDEVREYQNGDDVRTIDWNVTARTGKLHVKKYVEERELTVMLLLDASLSCHFASVHELKNRLAAEISAVLAFSAIQNNDKVGLIIFTDKIEKFIPARKGLKNGLRVIREALYYEPQSPGTDIPGALEYLSRVTTRKTVAFVISDFLGVDLSAQQRQRLKSAMAIANKRHDLIAITLNDPRDKELPDCGLLALEDAEHNGMFIIDSSDHGLRREYQNKARQRLEMRERFFQSVGVDYIDVATDTPYTKALIKFFLRRRKRRI